MDKHASNQPLQSVQGDPLSPPRQLSADALARRRLLIKGAGTGATSLAALSPMGAFASSTVVVCTNAQGKEVLCSISGTQSAAHSFGPNITKVAGGGYSSGWWGQVSNGQPRRMWPAPYTSASTTTKVGTVLTLASNTIKGLSLFQLMSDSTYANTPERHWLGAYLNALACAQGGAVWNQPNYAFPYTAQQVINFYLTQNAQAYAFFTGYMENI